MIIYKNVEQDSEKWFELRSGRLTGSLMDRIITPKTHKKAGETALRALAIHLCSKSIEPESKSFTGNYWTDWGKMHEPVARELFSRVKKVKVHQVGFILSDNPIVGCSPDGVIYRKNRLAGGLEIKCLSLEHHASIVEEGVLPDEYAAQVHGSMIVTGLKSWWFMSYYPGLKPFIIQVRRDEYTAKLEQYIEEFILYYATLRTRLMPLLLDGKEAA